MIDKRIQNQNDLLKIYRNTKTLSSFIGTKDGKSLKALWIRVSSILSIEEKKENNIPQGKITSFDDFSIEEIKLIKKIQSIKLKGMRKN